MTRAEQAISGALLAQGCYSTSEADKLAKLLNAKRRSHNRATEEVIDWIFEHADHPTNCYEFQDFVESRKA